jgi:hypothetical protein
MHRSGEHGSEEGVRLSVRTRDFGARAGVLVESHGGVALSPALIEALSNTAKEAFETQRRFDEGFFGLTVRAILRTFPGGEIDPEDLEASAAELQSLVIEHALTLAESHGVLQREDAGLSVSEDVKQEIARYLLAGEHAEAEGRSIRDRCADALVQVTERRLGSVESNDRIQTYIVVFALHSVLEALGFFRHLGV